MAHRFDIIIDGALQTYTRFEDIPATFEHLVAFVPEIPPGPHTHAQHEEIDGWQDKFNQLMGRARASSSQIR
jgi:hypothetical protein